MDGIVSLGIILLPAAELLTTGAEVKSSWDFLVDDKVEEDMEESAVEENFHGL